MLIRIIDLTTVFLNSLPQQFDLLVLLAHLEFETFRSTSDIRNFLSNFRNGFRIAITGLQFEYLDNVTE